MKLDDIKLMFEYNFWANNRILSMAANVTDEQWSQPTGFSWYNLHKTLLHTLDTEYGWRVLCQYSESTPVFSTDDFPDFESIQTRWQTEEDDMWAYLNSLSDDDMEGFITYKVPDGTRQRTLWHCLYHLVNHGTQHRSECAAMLTAFGHSPGDIDFTLFLNERA